MTALCGGGTSQPRPGVQILQNMSPNAVIALLYGEGMAWFGALAYGVGFLAYDLSGLCATDPPALPNVDGPRFWGYLNPANPQGAAQLRQDAQAIVGYWLWFQYCQCTTGTTPNPGPPLPKPSDQATDQINPPNTPGSCANLKTFFEPFSFAADNTATANGEPVRTPNANGQWYEFSFYIQQASTVAPPVPTDLTITLLELGTGGSTVAQHTFNWVAGTNPAAKQIYRFPWNAATTDYHVHVFAQETPTTNIQILGSINEFCSALPPQLSPACCPPDPNLLALINEVLQLEQEILAKAGPSIAYTLGTVHAGLTGSASISVSGLRGVLVNITGGSPSRPPLVGNPPYLWDMGWISAMDNNGFIDEKRLTRTTQVWTPRLGTNATTIGYYLDPGVTATITELVPA